MSLLNKVKELCSQNDITLSKLEKTLNFGNGTLSRWDDSSPSGDKLLKVASYFGVTTDYLLGADVKTIAAHKEDGENWTDEEFTKIEEYKQLLLAARLMRK